METKENKYTRLDIFQIMSSKWSGGINVKIYMFSEGLSYITVSAYSSGS